MTMELTALTAAASGRPVATLSDPKILGRAVARRLQEARSAAHGAEPRDVHGRGRGGLTTVLFVRDLVTGAGGLGFSFQINLWLWFTVLFANFAEAVAEGRGKAQAATLRKAQTETVAKRLADVSDSKWQTVPATSSGRATSCWSRRATSSRPTAR